MAFSIAAPLGISNNWATPMKPLKSESARGGALIQAALTSVLLFAPLLLIAGTGPQWWVDSSARAPSLAANDYGAVNQGQLKNLARAAMDHLDSSLQGGAGATLHGLIASWASSTTANDYAPVNLGQLKAVAKPFYDRLIEIGYTDHYPWLSDTNAVANDYAMANIGQVKNLFSFDVSLDADTPANGLPDWWEVHYFSHSGVVGSTAAPRGDGWTIEQCWVLGLSPLDQSDGRHPPVASTAAPESNVSEMSGSGASIVVTLSESVPFPLVVNYSVGGAATVGVDYQALSGTLNLAAGATSGTISIVPIPDRLVEGPEDVTITLSSGLGYTVVSDSSTATIEISDVPPVDKPTITPFGAYSLSPVSVTLGTVQGADLYYTLDGGEPDEYSNWIGQAGTLSMSTCAILRAKSFMEGCQPSDASVAFQIGPQIAADAAGHHYALGSDGIVWAWGANDGGLGTGGTGADLIAPIPLNSSTLPLPNYFSGAIAKSVAASNGGGFSGVIDSDGWLRMWGDNTFGQIGDGTQSTTPVNVPTFVNVVYPATRLALGRAHSVALQDNGTVFAWGNNSSGQIGNGSFTLATTPVQSATNMISIAAGGDFTLALGSDNTVWAWGANEQGQLGDSGTNIQSSPIQVGANSVAGPLQNIVAIVAGYDYALALKNDGAVWAWGCNSSGQLGIGSTNSQLSPVLVPNLSNVVALYTGSATSFALKSDGTVWAWGDNSQHQFGNGSVVSSSTPVQITALSGNTAFAFAGDHTLAAQTRDGNAVFSAWGTNSCGGLGTNNSDFQAVATQPDYVFLDSDGDGLPDWWERHYFGHLELSGTSLAPRGDGLTLLETFQQNLNPLPAAASIGLYPSSVELADSTANIPVVLDYPAVVPLELLYSSTGSAIADVDYQMLSGTLTIPVGGTSGTISIAAIPGHLFERSLTVKIALLSSTGYSLTSSSTATVRITNIPLLAPPVITPRVLYSAGKDSILMSGTNGARIQYTLDGSIPVESNPWSSSSETVWLSSPAILRTKAFMNGYRASETVSAAYQLGPQVAADGGGHQYALGGDGILWAWGANDGGLGTGGTGSDILVPSALSGTSSPWITGSFQGVATRSIAASSAGAFAGAVDSSGQVWMWGNNSDGQLGNGSTGATPVNVPTLVATSGTVAKLALGRAHSVALGENGDVRTWGDNTFGQLGDASFLDKTTPSQTPVFTGAVAVSAGGDFSLAVEEDGTVWAWGAGSKGQLGNSGTANQASPVQVGIGNTGGPLGKIVAVSAGHDYALALTEEGMVWAWGNNNTGQLGDGTTVSKSYAVPVPSLTHVAALYTGSATSYAVKFDGSVWVWGDNSLHQFGNGTVVCSSTPVKAAALSGLTAFASAGNHTLAAETRGGGPLYFVWGTNTHGAFGTNNSDPNTVATQPQYTDLDSDGNSFPDWWERCNFGRIGVIPSSLAPRGDGWTVEQCYRLGLDPMDASQGWHLPTVSVQADTPCIGEASGTAHLVIALSNSSGLPLAVPYALAGTAVSGVDYQQQALSGTCVFPVGVTSAIIPVTPIPDRQAGGSRTVEIALASGSNYALAASASTASVTIVDLELYPEWGHSLSSSNVSVWCDNPEAELHYTLDGSDPVATGTTTTVSGDTVALPPCALLRVKAFLGGSAYTQTTSVAYTSGPQVAADSAYHNYVLASDGILWAWGANDGALGTGTSGSNVLLPFPLNGTSPFPTGVFQSILLESVASSNGGAFSGAVDSSGGVWMWGSNDAGQLGLGSTSATPQMTPSLVPALPPMAKLALGRAHSIAVEPDGSIWVWGENAAGQLGIGTTLSGTNPGELTALSGAVSVAAGANFSAAVLEDGTVWAWGADSQGQLGDSGTANQSSPVQVGSNSQNGPLQGFVAVAAGYDYTLALKEDGTVWAWGNNTSGQLGDGTTASRSQPAPIPNLAGVAALYTGSATSFAVKSDGTVWAWGDNSLYQFGNGTVVSSSTPVQITALNNYPAFAFGPDHVLAVPASGTSGLVATWGTNTAGSLGIGSSNTALIQTAPVCVSSDANTNGLPDWWETYYGVTDPDAIVPGSNLTYRQYFQTGRTPGKGAVSESLSAFGLEVYTPFH